MSVNASSLVKIQMVRTTVPNNPLIGRWLGDLELTGDVSGGSYHFTFLWDNLIGSLLSTFGLWNLDQVTYWTSSAVTNPNARVYIDAWEMSTHSAGSRMSYDIQGMSLLPYQTYTQFLGKSKYQFSTYPGFATAVIVDVLDNVNAVLCHCHVDGRIWDERYIIE